MATVFGACFLEELAGDATHRCIHDDGRSVGTDHAPRPLPAAHRAAPVRLVLVLSCATARSQATAIARGDANRKSLDSHAKFEGKSCRGPVASSPRSSMYVYRMSFTSERLPCARSPCWPCALLLPWLSHLSRMLAQADKAPAATDAAATKTNPLPSPPTTNPRLPPLPAEAHAAADHPTRWQGAEVHRHRRRASRARRRWQSRRRSCGHGLHRGRRRTAPSPSHSMAAPAHRRSISISAPSAPSISMPATKATALPTPPISSTIPAPGSTSPTSSSSIPSAPASAARWCRKPTTKKLFYSTAPDIEYLSRIVYDWLVKNDRLSSRKYLVGESYGGFRGPRITHYLQSQLGVAHERRGAGLALSQSDHRE